MLRSIGAVLGGFAVMAVLVMIGTIAAAAALIPGGMSTMRTGADKGTVPKIYLAANLILSLLAAIAGGYVTTRIVIDNPMMHSVALAAFVLVMSVVSAGQNHGNANGQPAWYSKAIACVGICGVLLGGVIGAPR